MLVGCHSATLITLNIFETSQIFSKRGFCNEPLISSAIKAYFLSFVKAILCGPGCGSFRQLAIVRRESLFAALIIETVPGGSYIFAAQMESFTILQSCTTCSSHSPLLTGWVGLFERSSIMIP